ncbi:hypothetical protein, partial [Pedobacter sp.]
MAKLSAVILPHHSSFKVKIRIAHNGAKAFIDTGIAATKKDVSKGELRQSFIAEHLSGLLKNYNDTLLKLKGKLPTLTAGEIKSELLQSVPETKVKVEIDFLEYFSKF